ncbi:MAG: SagB/ThcOx family dehydrogenase [Lachnospiraceae bacterium]|nr:SagB/ThcOx family dehydrogenase [Lachnospiraceae bacterium]
MSQETMKNRTLLYAYGETRGPQSDQALGYPQPPFTAKKGEREKISLPTDLQGVITCNDFYQLVTGRKSSRLYEEDPLCLKELSYLLWMTQGVKEMAGVAHRVTLRNVPSAGARHALETYVFVNRVEELEAGCYHYLPEEHGLERISQDPQQIAKLSAAYCGQTFFGGSAVAFVWTAVPYRMEWRYGTMAEKLILLDAGHVCQNLYLAAGSIGCGVCAIGAYEQDKADELLGLLETRGQEREEEMVVYAASVGRK